MSLSAQAKKPIWMDSKYMAEEKTCFDLPRLNAQEPELFAWLTQKSDSGTEINEKYIEFTDGYSYKIKKYNDKQTGEEKMFISKVKNEDVTKISAKKGGYQRQSNPIQARVHVNPIKTLISIYDFGTLNDARMFLSKNTSPTRLFEFHSYTIDMEGQPNVTLLEYTYILPQITTDLLNEIKTKQQTQTTAAEAPKQDTKPKPEGLEF